MTYRILADLVLVAHGLFIAFVMFGGLLALCKPRLAYWHLPALAWGAMVTVSYTHLTLPTIYSV